MEVRHKDEYYDNLAAIKAYFGDKKLITQTDAGEYLKIARQTAAKRFDIPAGGITQESFARRLSGG